MVKYHNPKIKCCQSTSASTNFDFAVAELAASFDSSSDYLELEMRTTDYFQPRSLACWIALCMSSLLHDARAADVIVGVNAAREQLVPLNRLDHSAWNGLLQKYVDQQGMVQYAAWKKSAADVAALDLYLESLSHSNGQGTREEQLAFWINAYNAVTVKGILREYPTTSIRNHTARLFGYNIWKNLKLVVGGTPISLEDIEHKRLRKMSEPRIHFAIVCASLGCPRLLNEAYVADRVDAQLTLNAQVFFADPSKFRYDAARGVFSVSPILDWFAEDFGSSQAAQLKRIAAWLPDAPAQQAAASGTGRMSFLDYDWALNERK